MGIEMDGRPFADRADAGRKLATQLEHFRGEGPVVLGLARGGVVIAAEIARALGAELDVLIARKLGAPMQPELGVGAVAPDGIMALNHDIIDRLGLRREDLEPVAQREFQELERRLDSYSASRDLSLKDRVVIVADDGLATGYTALAAVRYVRTKQPKSIILAVPVCAQQALEMLQAETDEVVCVEMPRDLVAVGYWYENFAQVSDEEVLDLLRRPVQIAPPREVNIPVGGAVLTGDLTLPADAAGLVIFAHGSGSSRLSPRNQFVARRLNQGLARFSSTC